MIAQNALSIVIVVLSAGNGHGLPNAKVFASAIGMAYSTAMDSNAATHALASAIDLASAGTPNLVDCILPGLQAYDANSAAEMPVESDLLYKYCTPAPALAAKTAVTKQLQQHAKDAAAALMRADAVHVHVTTLCDATLLQSVAERLGAIVSTTPSAKVNSIPNPHHAAQSTHRRERRRAHAAHTATTTHARHSPEEEASS